MQASRGAVRVVPRRSIDRQSKDYGVRRNRRSNIDKEIYAMQHYQGFLFRRLPFARIIKQRIESLQQQRGGHIVDYRIQMGALDALQQATEDFIVDLFSMCQLCAEHSKRVTIMDRDLILVLRIRKLTNLM